ncbi:MAG: hypothetical protein EBU96_08275 [Actinobacteria bacterium]|nr:hypothetical protein [Actinomycetota bacterium]
MTATETPSIEIIKNGLRQMTEANMSLFAENQILRSRVDRMAEYLRHVSLEAEKNLESDRWA